MFAHGGSAVPLGVYLLRWCGEKENTLAVLYVIFAVGNFLIRGLTRRLRRGVQVQSRGVVNSFWQANRRGAGGERKAPCKRHYKATLPKAVPAGGLTRRLRRGRWGCRTEGGKYFLSKRKKVPKKAGGTATPEAARPAARRGLRSAVAPSGLSSTSVRFAHPPGKSLLLPILPAGLATSRVIKLDSYPQRLCALLCSPISAVKMGGPFSLRCLSPLCSPRRRRWADSNGGAWDSLVLRGWTRCFHGQTCFPIRGWCKPYSNYTSWTLRCNLDISARQKASVNLESR